MMITKLFSIVFICFLFFVVAANASEFIGTEKIEPALLAKMQSNDVQLKNQEDTDESYEVHVLLHDDQGKQARRKTAVKKIDQQKQNDVVDRLLAFNANAKILYRYQVINGFSALVSADDIRFLAALSQVRVIEELKTYQTAFNEAHPLTNVDFVQDNLNITGTGITLAIIDDGIKTDHPALVGKYKGGRDFGENDNDPYIDCPGQAHGTAVTSVLLGNQGNNLKGSALNADYVFLKIQKAGECGSNNLSGDIIAALDWIAFNKETYSIDIVSISLARSAYTSVCDLAPGQATLHDSLVALTDLGVIVFAASGNDGLCSELSTPACHSNVISVGAVYDSNTVPDQSYCLFYIQDGIKSCEVPLNLCGNINNHSRFSDVDIVADDVPIYSNSASFLDILAPAECATVATTDDDIIGCFSNGELAKYKGTSTSVAYAAGVAALGVEDVGEDILNWHYMRQALTATGFSVIDIKNAQSTPRVDAAAMIDYLPQVMPLQNGVPTVQLTGEQDSLQFFVLDVPANAISLTFEMTGGPDADLYVRYGDLPKFLWYDSENDCAPFLNGTSDEICPDPDFPEQAPIFANPTAGNWYAKVQGFSFIPYVNVTLVGTYRFPLTVIKDGNGTGTVTSNPMGIIDCDPTCNAEVVGESTIVLIPTADPGSLFVGWSGDCNGNGNFPLVMDGPKTCTATFVKQYELTVTRVGAGTGTVNSDPPGINCGNDCDEFYLENIVVDLIPTADPGSYFSGWLGDCTGNSNVLVTMDADKGCTAIFELLPPGQQNLIVNVIGTGSGAVTSNPDGINCGLDCGQLYDVNTIVTLVPAPDIDSYFVGWSGDCNGNGVTQVVMDDNNANKVCFATFDILPPNQYQLIVNTVGLGNVTGPNIDCGADCSELYAVDTVVDLVPVPAADAYFVGWSDDCVGDNNAQVIMDANKFCTATFAPLPPGQQQLMVNLAGTGSGEVESNPMGINCDEVSCSQLYDQGITVNLTPIPAADSYFVGWSGDEGCNSGDGVAQVTMDENKLCTATFNLLPPGQQQLIVNIIGSGSVSSNPAGIDCGNDCSELYAVNTLVDLAPAPAAAAYFVGWSGDCVGNGHALVTMNANKACTATFDVLPPGQQQLMVNLIGTGSGIVASNPAGINCGVDCSELYAVNSTIDLVSSSAADSYFVGWSGDCVGNGNTQVTMDANKACTATFDLLPPGQQQLIVSVIGSGTVTGPNIDCGNDCSELYAVDAVVSLTPVPDLGWVFVNWNGDCDDNGQVTMDANKTCQAVFAEDIPGNFTLTVVVSGPGTATVTSNPVGIDCGNDCQEVYSDGQNVALSVTLGPASFIESWQDDCLGQQGNEANITMDDNKICEVIIGSSINDIFADGFESN